MKKILVIAPYPYLPYFSGGQKFIAQFLEWLGKETSLTVLSTGNNEFSLAKNYKGIALLKNSLSRYYDRSLISKISELVRKEGFDTLICEHPYHAWLAFAVRKRTGIKMIIHTHNIEYQRFRSTGRWWWPLLKVYEKRAFKKADKLFFIAPEDRQFAIDQWHIEPAKCIDLPFGVEINENPSDKAACREAVAKKHDIKPGEKIILFSGLLRYKPNLDAVKMILDKVNPLLQNDPSFAYKIIICGKGLPAEMNGLSGHKNMIYAGFVSDIDVYNKAADIVLNPVQAGGGIKTKMVEAIAYGSTVVSTRTGAKGIDKSVCGPKLVIAPDNDWELFAKLVIDQSALTLTTPPEYYDRYFWGSIIKKLLPQL